MIECEYCHYDKDDCIRPIDKQGHVYISGSMEKTLCISWYGHRKDIPINYCPMCGRKLENSVREKSMKVVKDVERDSEIVDEAREYLLDNVKADLERTSKDEVFERMRGMSLDNIAIDMTEFINNFMDLKEILGIE